MNRVIDKDYPAGLSALDLISLVSSEQGTEPHEDWPLLADAAFAAVKQRNVRTAIGILSLIRAVLSSSRRLLSIADGGGALDQYLSSLREDISSSRVELALYQLGVIRAELSHIQTLARESGAGVIVASFMGSVLSIND